MLIWGTRWSAFTLGQLSYACSHCRKTTIHSAIARKGKFTLFFMPLFPISKQYLISCNLCGLRLKAVNDLRSQLEQLEQTGHLPNAQGTAPSKSGG
jgi:hypothetical protein